MTPIVEEGKSETFGGCTAYQMGFALEKGDVLVMLTGGGAGYGEPAERPRHLIEHDLAQGLIAPAPARRVYRFVPAVRGAAGRGPARRSKGKRAARV